MTTPRTVRVTHTPDGVELYFPPLRMPQVAIPLAAFGIIAAAIPGIVVVALLPDAIAHATTLLAATLIAGFVLPFLVFGVIFVVTAAHMVSNALLVNVHAGGIETARLLFGVVVKRKRIGRSEIESVQPEIASRYQSLFSPDPVYQLVARGKDSRRVVVGETLQGEAEMERVKALVENPNRSC